MGKKPIAIVQGDLARHVVDAIVNATTHPLLGEAGVDGANHRAAGTKTAPVPM